MCSFLQEDCLLEGIPCLQGRFQKAVPVEGMQHFGLNAALLTGVLCGKRCFLKGKPFQRRKTGYFEGRLECTKRSAAAFG